MPRLMSNDLDHLGRLVNVKLVQKDIVFPDIVKTTHPKGEVLLVSKGKDLPRSCLVRQ